MRKIFTITIVLLLMSTARSTAVQVQWSTYFGNTSREYGSATATDRFGNVYLVGNTSSASGISTSGAFQSTFGGGSSSSSTSGDAFLAKFNSLGQLLWSTYFGGSDDDGATGVATDSAGNIYVTGWTKSSNGIAGTNAFQPTLGGSSDAFLAKFDSSGQRIWSTYYGGSGTENAILIGGIYVSAYGSIYITGTTTSANNIASAGSHQPAFLGGSSDAFLAKFSANGQRIWGTYFGSSTNNLATSGIGVSGFGNAVYITGNTTSTTGVASSGAYQSTYAGGTNDAFLARFDTTGAINWATYFGGTLDDKGTAIACDANGVFLNGTTTSTAGIASSGSQQNTLSGNQDVFLARFSHIGQLLWSTYYGGTVLDASASYMAIDAFGNAYITGSTSSTTNIATTNALQPATGGGRDAFVAKYGQSGNLLWGTYLGGTGTDYGYGLSRTDNGIIYISGRTTSGSGIATAGAHSQLLGGDNDCFLTAINDCIMPLKPDTIIGPTNMCKRTSATYRINPVAGALYYSWILPNGWTGNSTADTINITTGLATGSIKVVAKGICSTSDTQTLTVYLPASPSISPLAPRICSGDSIKLSSGPLQLGTKQWFRNGVLLQNDTSYEITARQSGTYVLVVSLNGCSDTSNEAIVTVHPLPNISPIVKTGQVLSLNASYSSYQWNFNGLPITGATSATFTYAVEGNYSVTVTDTNGCKNTSPTLNTASNSVPSINRALALVYPNPANGVDIHVVISIAGYVSLVSADGKTILRCHLGNGLHTIPTYNLASGMYFLHLAGDNGLHDQCKLMVQHN